MTSRCDVICDVIIMKIIFVDDLHTIFLYLLSNWGYIENWEFFKLTKIWGAGELFNHQVSPEVCDINRIAKATPNILSYWSS